VVDISVVANKEKGKAESIDRSKASSKIKKELKQTYDTIAEDFDRTRHKPWEEVIEFLTRIHDKNAVILDLGCGNGRHLRAAKEIGFHNLIAVDFSDSFIEMIQKNMPEATAIKSDLTDAALHHLPTEKERLQSLKECKRVMKKDSRIIVSCWSAENTKFAKVKNDTNDIMHTWDKKHKRFYHLFEKNELSKLLKKAGFKGIKEWSSKDNHWATGAKNV
jgi:tRNA (uracil-5-)-methyltransferase TRM9